MKLLVIILFLLVNSFSLPAAPYERFEEHGKVGIKDQGGNIILPASFDALGWSDGSFSVIGQITGYRQNNRWGLLNLKKEFITLAEFETLTCPGADRVVASKLVSPFALRFGCLDLAGKTGIPFSYDDIVLHGLRAIVMIKRGARYEYGLVDLSDRSILPIRYKEILPIGSLRYAVKDFSDKIALCTEEGKWVSGFEIDRISDFQYDWAVIHKGWKQGVIDRNGNIVIAPLYREIRITAPSQATARKADEWKMIDIHLKDLAQVEADDLTFFDNGWMRMTIDGKKGLVDENLQPRWPLDYEYIGPIKNQMAIIKKHGRFSLLHLEQSPVLSESYDSLCIQGNLIRARQTNAGRTSWELYDTFGIKKTSTSYDFIDGFNGKFLPAKSHGFWGGVDRYGKERIACVYDSLLEMNDQLLVVWFKGQYGIITLDDEWRLPPQPHRVQLLDADHFLENQGPLIFLKTWEGTALYFTDNRLRVSSDHLTELLPDGTEKEINFQGQIVSRNEPVTLLAEETFRESEGLTGIKRDGKFGFVDGRGRLRIANRYESIGEFHDARAPIKLLGKWGFIDPHDQIVIQPTFEKAEGFSKGVAVVSRQGKSGLIGTAGEPLLSLSYDSIARLPGEFFLLMNGGLKGLADAHGKILIEPRFDYLELVSTELVIVSRQGNYGVLTIEGVGLLPLQYRNLIFLPTGNKFMTKKESSWESLVLKASE